MGITVEDLLNRPFLSRSRQDKYNIIADGKPRPHLNMAAVVMANDADKPEVQTRHFSLAMYEEVPWLTGCEKRESLFCWPCLLFSCSGPWNTTGISDFGYVIEGMHTHGESPEHIKATLQLQDIVEPNITLPDENEKQLLEKVKRNRAIQKRLTDVVCNLLIKEQPHYKRKNSCQISPDSCVKNLQFLRNYDVLNCNYIENAIDLINKSPSIVNDLVDTISELIKQGIKKEIQSSSFVSVILSDHTEVPSMPQISTVLRYTKDGKIHERFVGFSNMGNHPASIYEHITDIIKQFAFSEKFIAVSLDGGVLSLSEASELAEYVRSVYPRVCFVPWHSHGFIYVLQQSLSNINDCRLFFKTINNLKIYFQKKSRRLKALEVFMSANNPALEKSKKFIRSQMIKVLNTHRKYFILFFESVVQNSHKWSADEIAKALGFQKVLEDFKTVFLLEVFSRLFQHTSTLNDILNSRSPKNIFDDEALSQLNKTLKIERYREFDQVWTTVQFEVSGEVLGLQPKRLKMEVDSEIQTYRELYSLIFDQVIHEIDIRFNDLKKIKFCNLLNLNSCVEFTNQMLQQLMILWGPNFDDELVKNEFIVLRSNSMAFKDKSTYDMLQSFSHHSTLKNTFSCVHKITEFFFSLPIKPTSEEADLSKLQDIIDWSYVPTETGATSGDVSIPCVELDFLQDLKKSNSFQDDVFADFQKVTKTFELLQK